LERGNLGDRAAQARLTYAPKPESTITARWRWGTGAVDPRSRQERALTERLPRSEFQGGSRSNNTLRPTARSRRHLGHVAKLETDNPSSQDRWIRVGRFRAIDTLHSRVAVEGEVVGMNSPM